MPHAAGTWCSQRFAQAESTPLTHLDARFLLDLLQTDAEDYCYSAPICIADACRAIQGGFYSWATVKLYYSCFYSLRGLLALRGHGIFYVDEKPKIISAAPGNYFRNPTNSESRGGTHGLTIRMFDDQFNNHVLSSQPIGATTASIWMKLRREEVNYGHAKYYELGLPKWMQRVASAGLRRSLNAYISDTRFLYTFDEEHAIMAFPILAIRSLLTDMAAHGRVLGEADLLFLARIVADQAGPIVEWSRLLRDS